MDLKNISEKIYEGRKIMSQHCFKKKSKEKDLILCLFSKDLKENKLIVNEETKFIKQSTLQRYYSANFSREVLAYNDILFDKKTSNLFLFKEDVEYKIIPTEEFVIIRPKSFLKTIIEEDNGHKYLLDEMKKIYRVEHASKIELIKYIYIPKNRLEIENLFRPDRKKIDDLTKINIKQGLMTLDKVIKRIKNEEIIIETSKYFQRRKDLWSQEIKSRFIEALIVRQPIPAFYFDATDDDKWLIVDGLQRLSAVREFIIEEDEPLILKDLYYLSDEEFENKTFEQLPRYAQRNIEEYEIMVYKIEPPTPDEVKLKIFKSINTSALVLTNQEIRHALNHKRNKDDESSPSEYVEKLSKIKIFENICEENNIKEDRMKNRELVLRYLSFRITPFQNYKPTMTEFLDESMTELYRKSKKFLDKYKKDFGEALFTIDKIYGKIAFRKSMFFENQEKDYFINNYFETWTYIFSIINDNDRKKLIKNKSKVIEETKELIKHYYFKESIETKNAYTYKNIQIRFNVANDFISKLLK